MLASSFSKATKIANETEQGPLVAYKILLTISEWFLFFHFVLLQVTLSSTSWFSNQTKHLPVKCTICFFATTRKRRSWWAWTRSPTTRGSLPLSWLVWRETQWWVNEYTAVFCCSRSCWLLLCCFFILMYLYPPLSKSLKALKLTSHITKLKMQRSLIY